MSLNYELLNLIIQYNMEGEGEMVEIVCLKLGIMQGFWLIKLSQWQNSVVLRSPLLKDSPSLEQVCHYKWQKVAIMQWRKTKNKLGAGGILLPVLLPSHQQHKNMVEFWGNFRPKTSNMSAHQHWLNRLELLVDDFTREWSVKGAQGSEEGSLQNVLLRNKWFRWRKVNLH